MINLAWAGSFVRIRGNFLAPRGMVVPWPKSFTEFGKVSLFVGYYEPTLQKDKSIMECGVTWE